MKSVWACDEKRRNEAREWGIPQGFECHNRTESRNGIERTNRNIQNPLLFID
jgi:hypothetical protein